MYSETLPIIQLFECSIIIDQGFLQCHALAQKVTCEVLTTTHQCVTSAMLVVQRRQRYPRTPKHNVHLAKGQGHVIAQSVGLRRLRRHIAVGLLASSLATDQRLRLPRPSIASRIRATCSLRRRCLAPYIYCHDTRIAFNVAHPSHPVESSLRIVVRERSAGHDEHERHHSW